MGHSAASSLLTVSSEGYGRFESALNQAAGVLGRLGSAITSLDVMEILETARRRTGLDDFGDSAFVSHLEALVQSADEVGVTALARLANRQTFIKSAEARLRIEAYLKVYPEVLDIPIHRPIFVVGFPRTGTTAMQNWLSAHPERRGLEFWELIAPVPQSHDPAGDAQRRIRKAEQVLSFAYWMAPEMRQIHEIRAQSLEECWGLMTPTFAVLNYAFQTGSREYLRHLLGADLRWAYREYRRSLQILLHQRPATQLVLKCPEHLWFMDELLEVFPDACIVWPHRHPREVLGSYCSLMSLSRRFQTGCIDHRAFGTEIMDICQVGVERGMNARERHASASFFDVGFQEIIDEPVRVLERIDARFGFEPWDGWLSAVRGLSQTRRGDARGSHRYDATRYGIDDACVETRFGRYIDSYLGPRGASQSDLAPKT